MMHARDIDLSLYDAGDAHPEWEREPRSMWPTILLLGLIAVLLIVGCSI